MDAWLILCSALAFALVGARPAAAAEPPPALQAELGRIGSQADGVVGIAAWRLDGRGPRVLVNGDQPFPMASTVQDRRCGRDPDARSTRANCRSSSWFRSITR